MKATPREGRFIWYKEVMNDINKMTLAQLQVERIRLKHALAECGAIQNSCGAASAIFRENVGLIATLNEQICRVNQRITHAEQLLWDMKPRAHCPHCYHPVILRTPAHLQEVFLFGVRLPVELQIVDLQCVHCKGPRMRKY